MEEGKLFDLGSRLPCSCSVNPAGVVVVVQSLAFVRCMRYNATEKCHLAGLEV